MKLKEQTIREIEDLTPRELGSIYDLILCLKNKRPESTIRDSRPHYKKVRTVLSKCKGSLSEDIISARRDRI